MEPYEGEMLRLAMSLAIPLAAARVVKTLGVTLFNLGKKDKFWPGYVWTDLVQIGMVSKN